MKNSKKNFHQSKHPISVVIIYYLNINYKTIIIIIKIILIK